MHYVHAENAWWKKSELNKWRDIQTSWIEKFGIIKVSVLSQGDYTSTATSAKVLACLFFIAVNRMILKFIWKGKRVRMAQAEREKILGTHLCYFKTPIEL